MSSYTIELLDAVASTTETKSDYAAGKALGITKQAIWGYRKRGSQMGDEAAFKAAEILGLDPAYVLARLHAESAKSDKVRALWNRIGLMSRNAACIAVAAGTIGMAGNPTAQASPASPGANSIYYVK